MLKAGNIDYLILVGKFLRPIIKHLDDPVAVMFGNEIVNATGQPVAAGQFQSIANMADDDAGTHIGIKMIVRVATILIFAEEWRPVHLANIMIKSAYSNQGAVRLNLFGRLFRQISNHDAVMVSARRPPQ